VLPAIVSALHLTGVALGVSALIARELAIRGQTELDDARRAALFRADNWNGLAAILLIGGGLWRLLAGLEKPTIWYMHDYAFMAKMSVLLLVMSCEMWPMFTLIRWRIREKKKLPIDYRRLGLLRTLNRIELVGLFAIIPLAATMAHGAWHQPPSSDPACAVQDEIATRCLACHSTSGTQGGLVMSEDLHGSLVDQPSSQWPTILRVAPGKPEASLLYLKVAGKQGIRGLAMPMGQPPDEAFAALIERWILDGAKKCER
jgi:putative membrane protein